MRLLFVLLIAATAAFGQFNRLGGKPLCSATVTTNCVPSANASGNVTVSTSGPVTVSGPGFYYNNASGALTYNLPAITASNIGAKFCFRNLTTRTGAITLQAPASTYIDSAGANGSAAGTLVSGGALGDNGCLQAVTTTQYVWWPGLGTWTNN